MTLSTNSNTLSLQAQRQFADHSADAKRMIAKLIDQAASQSRLQDVDDAGALARLTRAQILQQAAAAMLTPANGQASAVLALLR